MGKVPKLRHFAPQAKTPSQSREIFSALIQGNIDTFKTFHIQISDLTKTKPIIWRDQKGIVRSTDWTIIDWARKYEDQSLLDHIFEIIKIEYEKQIHAFKSSLYFSMQDTNTSLLMLALACNQPSETIRTYEQYTIPTRVLQQFGKMIEQASSTSYLYDMDQEVLRDELLEVSACRMKIDSISEHYALFMNVINWEKPQLKVLNIYEQMYCYFKAQDENARLLQENQAAQPSQKSLNHSRSTSPTKRC